jgi:2-oxoisovalerate dehydrogenase E1 component
VLRLGEIGVRGEGTDLAIVTYGNGFYLSAQAQWILAEQHQVSARVIDMRWLAPLPGQAILEAVAPCDRVLIVDECRVTGSQSEALMALFAERSSQKVARLAAEDCFIATGPAYAATLPSRDGVVDAALKLLGPRVASARA